MVPKCDTLDISRPVPLPRLLSAGWDVEQNQTFSKAYKNTLSDTVPSPADFFLSAQAETREDEDKNVEK